MSSPSRVWIGFLVSAGLGAAIAVVVLKSAEPECPACEPSVLLPARAQRETSPRVVGGTTRVADDSDVRDCEDQTRSLRSELEAQQDENDRLMDQLLANDDRFYGYSEEQLVKLALNCEVRSDSAPGHASQADQLDLRPEELEVFLRVVAEFQDQDKADRLALLQEVGVDVSGYDELDVMEREMLWARSFSSDDPDNPNRWKEIIRQIAEERAGLRAPLSTTELAESTSFVRFARSLVSSGDRFAAALALELGEARVHELRAKNGGWTGGGRREFGCPNSE